MRPRQKSFSRSAVLLAFVILYIGIPNPTQAGDIWSLTGSMNTGRFYHTATRLADGRVLVTGGDGGNITTTSILAGAEIYDPALGTWSSTSSMSTPRYHHTLAANGFEAILTSAVTNAE